MGNEIVERKFSSTTDNVVLINWASRNLYSQCFILVGRLICHIITHISPHLTHCFSRWRVLCQLTGHTGFVNAVASLKVTEEFPKGLIVTGGQDKVINIYCTG